MTLWAKSRIQPLSPLPFVSPSPSSLLLGTAETQMVCARRRPLPFPLLLLFLLLLVPPPQTEALWPGTLLWQWRNLVSLSHSLMLRVANARHERGDFAGAERAAAIADKLQFLGRGGGVWSIGWDYARNYAWRDLRVPGEGISGVVGELLSAFREVGRMGSEGERGRWAERNYSKLVSLSNSLFRGLLGAFSRSGPLREMVMILQREVEEGGLVQDCLDVGAKDLEGLATIGRDLLFGSNQSSNDHDHEYDL